MMPRYKTLKKYGFNPFLVTIALIFLLFSCSFCIVSCCSHTVPLAQTYPVSVPPSVLSLPSISAAGSPHPKPLNSCGPRRFYSSTMAYSPVNFLQLITNLVYFVFFTIPKKIFFRICNFAQRNFLVTFSIALVVIYFFYRTPSSYRKCEKAVMKSLDSCGEIVKNTYSMASNTWNRCINWAEGTCMDNKQYCKSKPKHHACNSRKYRHHRAPCIQERLQNIEEAIELDEQDKNVSETEHHRRRMKLLKELGELLDSKQSSKSKRSIYGDCLDKNTSIRRLKRTHLPLKSKSNSSFFLRKLCSEPLFKQKSKFNIHNETMRIVSNNLDNHVIPNYKKQSCKCQSSTGARVIDKNITSGLLHSTHKGKCFCKSAKTRKNVRNSQTTLYGNPQLFKSKDNSSFEALPKRQFHHCKCKRFIISKRAEMKANQSSAPNTILYSKTTSSYTAPNTSISQASITASNINRSLKLSTSNSSRISKAPISKSWNTGFVSNPNQTMNMKSDNHNSSSQKESKSHVFITPATRSNMSISNHTSLVTTNLSNGVDTNTLQSGLSKSMAMQSSNTAFQSTNSTPQLNSTSNSTTLESIAVPSARVKVRTIAAIRPPQLPISPVSLDMNSLGSKAKQKLNTAIDSTKPRTRENIPKQVTCSCQSEIVQPVPNIGILSDLLGGNTIDTIGDEGGCSSIGGLSGYDGMMNNGFLQGSLDPQIASMPDIPEYYPDMMPMNYQSNMYPDTMLMYNPGLFPISPPYNPL